MMIDKTFIKMNQKDTLNTSSVKNNNNKYCAEKLETEVLSGSIDVIWISLIPSMISLQRL